MHQAGIGGFHAGDAVRDGCGKGGQVVQVQPLGRAVGGKIDGEGGGGVVRDDLLQVGRGEGYEDLLLAEGRQIVTCQGAGLGCGGCSLNEQGVGGLFGVLLTGGKGKDRAKGDTSGLVANIFIQPVKEAGHLLARLGQNRP